MNDDPVVEFVRDVMEYIHEEKNKGMTDTAEQQARDMLERMGVEDAQSWSAGEVVELANLIADRRPLASGTTPGEVPAMDYAKFNEVYETAFWTDANEKLRNGWTLLNIVQRTAVTEKHGATHEAKYVVGRNVAR